MWLLVLVLGLSGIAVACLTWFVRWRRARRIEHERLWRQHHDWQQQSRHDSR